MLDEKLLDEFIQDYGLNRKNGISFVISLDFEQLKSAGCSVEELLDYLNGKYQTLLHGSRTDINESYLEPSKRSPVFASDLGAIAIMKALVSNQGLKHPGLVYPFFIDGEHKLELRIYGMHDDTIGKRGFVYVIPGREGFVNDPKGSWQYVSRAPVPISAKIEILIEDFRYPIYDMTKDRRLQ